MVPSLVEFYVVIAVMCTVFVLSYLLVYNPVLRLGQFNVLNRRPFTCWLCSNLWAGVFIWLNLAYIWDIWFLLWGGIGTVMTSYVIWSDSSPF